MAHFYEIISKKEFSYEKEISKLRTLFFGEHHHFNYYSSYECSIAQYIDDDYFRELPISSNYLHLNEMWSDLLDDEVSKVFLFLCELVLSIEKQLNVEYELLHVREETFCNALQGVVSFIEVDLNKLNLKYEYLDTDYGVVATILPKDPLLEEAINENCEKDLQQLLVEYKSVKLEGDIKTKEEILTSISKYVEPFLTDKSLKEKNKRLFDNTSFLLNNLHIRHNNVEINEQKFYKKTLKEREKWLDDLFVCILLVLKSKEELQISNNIEKLKDK